ncbi:MAG: hypothetical protein MI923_30485 [Phycisphaerales bacterium]|nr:hypothetical protein [Phycisphaerales bacterium]
MILRLTNLSLAITNCRIEVHTERKGRLMIPIPFITPSFNVLNLPLIPKLSPDLLYAALIGAIDSNPMLDLVLTPIAWAFALFAR